MRERRRNLIRCGAVFAVACCLLAGTVFPAAADTSVSGATMRLSSREGTVIVAGKGGKEVAAFDNMRLQSGYSLETKAASYAGLAMDDAKAVKMDALSKGEIRKKGKQLELLLSEGSLLCNVTAPLEGEESLSIRTSTMITGIRGTVVYAEVVDSNTSRVCVLEGQVLVRPVNPVEGDRNGQYIGQGQQALVIGPDRTEGRGEIQTLSLTEADIAPYVLWEIHENEALAERLREAGWDVDWIIENAEQRLKEEEDKNSRWAEDGQGTSGSKPGGKDIHTPLFGGEDSESGSDSGSGVQPGRAIVVIGMPADLGSIQEVLWTSDVVLSGTVDDGPLAIGDGEKLTVPAGGRLQLDEGIGVTVDNGGSLQVDGTMLMYSEVTNKGSMRVNGTLTVRENVVNSGYIEVNGTMDVGEELDNSGTLQVNGTLTVNGTLVNKGTVMNTSMNTLDIAGSYEGSGALYNRGRMVTDGSFIREGGSFQAIGQGCLEVEGEAVIENADFDFGTGNTLFHGDLAVKSSDGEFGDNLMVEGMLSLEDSSIQITGGFYGGGITAENGELNLEGGRVVAGSGADAVISVENCTLNVESGILERANVNIPFISGTGILEMHGEEYNIEELTESMFVSEKTETGWVLTGIVQEDEKQANMLTSIQLQADAEKLPDVNEEELQEGENLPGEDNPEEGESQPEEGNPEEGGNNPEEGNPEEGGNNPEEGNPEEGGSQPEEGNPEEGGSNPEEGNPEEGGSQPEEGKLEEGGNLPEEGNLKDSGNSPG